MGNQQIKDQLNNVTDKDFSDEALAQWLPKVFSFEMGDSGDCLQSLPHDILSSDRDAVKAFPFNFKIEEGSDASKLFVANTTASAGFTSGEKKIDELRSEDSKLLYIHGNAKSISFEEAIQLKMAVLTAMLMTRHKGGETLDDLIVHAQKQEADMSDSQAFGAAFKALTLCTPSSLAFMLDKEPAFVKQVLQDLLDQSRGVELAHSAAGNDLKALADDVRSKSLHDLLVLVARSKADRSIKTLAVRLMLRLGYIFASAADCLLAAQLQDEFKLDISWELQPLLDKPEKFRKFTPPVKVSEGGIGSIENKLCDQSRVNFDGADDRTTDSDNAIHDDKYYYMWSAERGIYKGEIVKESNYHWSDSKGASDIKGTYKKVTFVNIDGKIHIRSGHLPEEPFVELDRETCKIKEDYVPFTSEDNLLNWTADNENSTIGDESKGYRYLRATQMHYRNDELWVMAVYKENSWTSSVKQYVVEVYKRTGRHFKRIQEIPLFKENGTDAFKGAKRRGTEYTDRGVLHKNNKMIMWCSGKTFYLFDRSTGQRLSKQHENSTQHVIFYHHVEKKFTWMDCACYSYFYRLDICKYDPEQQLVALETGTVEMPVLFDEVKQNIKQLLMDANTEEIKVEAKEGDEDSAQVVKQQQKSRKRPALNYLPGLMGLEKSAPARMDDIPTLTSNKDVHEQTRSIIYSFINVEANYSMQAAQHNSHSPPYGDAMMKFYKAPFGVHLTHEFVTTNTKNTQTCIKAYASGNEQSMIELMTQLHLLLGSLHSFKCCRMSVNQLLSKEDMQKINNLAPLLQKIAPKDGAKAKAENDMTNADKISILVSQLAHDTAKTIMIQLDTVSAKEKLMAIQQKLNSANPEQAQDEMVKLADEDVIRKLYDDNENIKSMRLVLNGCCFTVNQRLKSLLQAAVSQKQFNADFDSEFAQTAANLQRLLCKELCACYGDQLYIILTTKDKASGAKPDDMDDLEWTSLCNKYERAVESLKSLDQVIFHAFINISEHIMFQMNTLCSKLQAIDPANFTEAEIKSLTESLQTFFSREASILRSVSLFSLVFTTVNVDVTWLDEIAEGLRNVLTALNGVILTLKRLYITETEDLKMNENPLVIYLQSALRQISYTLGHVAGRLIQQDQTSEEDDNMLSRLSILQGGVENRFIPGLSEQTKIQIEGSFKITGDKQLQKLALSGPENITHVGDDTMLLDVMNNSESVRLTLDVLHQALLTKQPMCVFARLGGNDGATISRAAFAAILKFSDSLSDFQKLNSEAKRNGSDVKAIVAAFREAKNEEFESLLKRWEQANQMRKWTQQVKLITSERTQQEAEVAYREAWNVAHPSEDPLSGQLSEEQKSEVEAQSDQKFSEELKKTYADVVKKAECLIKLQIPANQRKKKVGGTLLGKLGKRMSMDVHAKVDEEKKLHILIQQSNQKQQKDSEYDWRDRLKQWKKVQQAEGAIADIGGKSQLNSNSVSLTILGLLQSEHSVDKINSTVEKALIDGLRRCAGLNLLNFGMGLSGNEDIFQDMLQWFSASLRSRKNTTVHFLDGLAGCGQSNENSIRSQFFKIYEMILLKLKILDLTYPGHVEIKLLLQNLCWNFKAEDHELLSKLKVFDFLAKGDGTDLCWVNFYQGRYKHHTGLGAQDLQGINIARLLQQVVEFLQNQVLSSILETDSEAQAIESKQSQAKMVRSQSTLNEKAAIALFTQMTQAAWHSLERSLRVNRMGIAFEYVSDKYEMNRLSHNFNVSQTDDSNVAQHSSLFNDCRKKDPSIKTIADLTKKGRLISESEEKKLNLLIRRIEQEERGAGLSDELESFMLGQVGPALGLRVDLSIIIEHVKSNDLKVKALLRRTSYAALGLTESSDKVEEAVEAGEEKKPENDGHKGSWDSAITLLDKEQKQNQTFRRTNEELGKKEVMAYGVKSSMMNDETSYFCREERDDAVWRDDEYKQVLRLIRVCWWDPKAWAEHVPKKWTKIDVALYHGFAQTAEVRGSKVKVEICSQEKFQEGEEAWTNVHESDLRQQEHIAGEGLKRQHIVTVDVPEEILANGDYCVKVQIWEHGGGWKDGWFWQGFGVTPHDDVELGDDDEEEVVVEMSAVEKLVQELRKVAKVPYKERDLIDDQYENRTHYFGYVAQSRFLMQLEQVIGVAEKNALINSLLQESMHPQKLQQLVELAAQAHPIVQQLVQRIFQTLLRIELPEELYEKAIEASAMTDARGLPTRLAKLLAMKGVLSFPESKFLQLLSNLVQVTFEKYATRDNIVSHHALATTHEIGRTLRIFQQLPLKNKTLAELFKQRLSHGLCRIDEVRDAEAETLCFLASEMRLQSHVYAGQSVRFDSGEHYVVLSNSYGPNEKEGQVLLYCEQKNPERQQVIDTEQGQENVPGRQLRLTPVMEIDSEVTITAAKNSVLMDPEVALKLINLAARSEEHGIGHLSSLTMRSIVNSINRGMKHMIETLKAEYIELLASNNLLDPLLNYFVMVSGQSAIPFKEQLRCVGLQDMKLEQMRYTAQRKESRSENAIMMPEWESGQVMIRNKRLAYDTVKNNVKVAMKYDFVKIKNKMMMKERTLGKDEGDLVCVSTDYYSGFDAKYFEKRQGSGEGVCVVLPSSDIKELSFSTINLLSKARIVYTDDEASLEELIEGMVTAFKNQNNSELHQALCGSQSNWFQKSCYVQVSKQDLDRLMTWYNRSHLSADQPDSENLDYRAKIMNELARRVQASNGGKDLQNDSNFDKFETIQIFMAKLSSDNMEVADVMAALLAEQGDSLDDSLKEHITNIKDGVELVVPVSEDQVADVKAKMAAALAERFNKKKENDELPNFAQIFLDQEAHVHRDFKECWLDPNHDSGRMGLARPEEAVKVGPNMTETISADSSDKSKFRKVFIAQKVLNEAICRDTLITILGETGDKLSESSREMLNKEELRTRLDDLIHNNHMVVVHQAVYFAEKDSRKLSEDRIRAVLKLFAESETIKTFLVDDLIKRAKETLKNAMEENFYEFTDRSMKLATTFRRRVKLEAILDPTNLVLLSKNFFELSYIADDKFAEHIVCFFELSLMYALMFISDQYSQVSLELLGHVMYLLWASMKRIELFAGKPELLSRLTENGIIKMLVESIGEDQMREQMNQKNQLLATIEIADALDVLKNMADEKIKENVKLGFEASPKVLNQLQAIKILRDGTAFTSEINDVKFKTLLAANDPQVKDIGCTYETFPRRFKTNLNMTLPVKDEDWTVQVQSQKSTEFLKVSCDDGSMILMDKSSFQSGSSTKLVCKAGKKMTVEFPCKPQLVKWIGCMRSRNGKNKDKFQRLDRFDLMMETAAFSPVSVHAESNHVTFVAADGSIYGLGMQANCHSYSEEIEKEGLRKIELPDGVDVNTIDKVHASKFCRNVRTNDGRMFFNGHAKWYDYTSTNTANENDMFAERFENNFLRVEEGDKIIDWVSGYHYNSFLTEKGKIISQGYAFWHNFDSDVRHNTEQYEDHPFTLNIPAGWKKAIKLFPCMKHGRLYVNLQKEDGKVGSFSVGHAEGMLGDQGKFNQLELPQGIHFTKMITPHYGQTWAIDNQHKLWVFGTANHEISTVMPESEPLFATNDFNKPCNLKWFKEQKLRVLDVEGGIQFCIVLTENENGKRELYGLGQKMRERSNGEEQVFPDRFGPNAKAVFKTCVYLITDVDADSVSSFACTQDACFFVLKDNTKKPVSIIPEKPEAQGLIHFYKKDDQWHYVSEEEYSEKQHELPNVCFATRSTISNFGDRPWPDLHHVESQIELASEGEPTYYAKYRPGVNNDDAVESVIKVTASESQALGGSETHQLNPVIYIRTKTPSPTALEALETLKLSDFYELEEGETGFTFSFAKSSIAPSAIEQLELLDEDQKTFLRELQTFTRAEDAQLIQELDNLCKEKQQKIQKLNPNTIEPSAFCMSAESALGKKGEKLLKLRCQLLLNLVGSYISVAEIFNMEKKHQDGSVSQLLHSQKFLMPSSVSSELIDRAVSSVSTGYGPTITVSRRKAMVFAQSGKIDHEGKYSQFGQIINQLVSSTPDMSNFRITSTDDKCYSINFLGEGSIDAGGPFRDSLTNIAEELESGVAPILIRTPNNRNEHGINRDCFIIDSRSSTPAHKTMLRYFGGFLAFAFLSKSPMPFNLAPWVWKQLVEEELTLNDLEGIDAYTAQVLRDLQQHAQTLSDEDFEAGVEQFFTTVLSSGEEVPLCEGGETIRVTKNNIDEFIAKVLETRRNEGALQISIIREGFQTVVPANISFIFDLLNWSTMEARCTGEKHISIERLKSITTFPNNPADHEVIPRFWRVFEAWSDVERSAYLKFVWGRSRLPIDLQRLSNKHQVRLMNDMNNMAFPQSHTCFFQLDIPNYETDEMMSSRLSVAAQLCGEMDTDNNAAEDLD